MAFSSLQFLFLFLPLFALLYFCFPLRIKNSLLSLFSLIFLVWASPSYSLVLIFSVIMNWGFGLSIHTHINQKSGKRIYILALISNLALLLAFKYSGFFMGNLNLLLNALHFRLLKVPNWLLPLGISFYTFRMLSYQIELFRGKIKPEKKILNLFLYAAYFPQLGAGPIVRYSAFNKQLVKRNHKLGLVKSGLQRFLLGLAKKALLANNLGLVADAIFNLSDIDQTFYTSCLGVIAYTLQVYYDFSGYSDMAIGLSAITGFHAPENFNFPYKAKSVQDFWRRWHMTLTSWFRDFLFLPLAFTFSRKMPAEKYYTIKTDHIIYGLSILVTWLLVGFWHGASWTFIAWGFTFGIFLILEHIGLGRKLKKAGSLLQYIYTLTVVVIAWIFFRASSFHQGFAIIKGLFGFNGLDTVNFEYYRYFTHSFILAVFIAIAGAGGWLSKFCLIFWRYILRQESKHPYLYKTFKISIIFRTILALLLLFAFGWSVAEILRGGYSPFIYFRF